MSNWQNRIINHGVVDPNELIPNAKNWREHSVSQREAINGVLDQVGWVQSVIVNKNTGNIVDGHLRVDEAIKNGEQVPVVYVDLTEDEESLILATIDPISAMAETNSGILNGLIEGLQVDNENVEKLLDQIKDTDSLDDEILNIENTVPSKENIFVGFECFAENVDLVADSLKELGDKFSLKVVIRE